MLDRFNITWYISLGSRDENDDAKQWGPLTMVSVPKSNFSKKSLIDAPVTKAAQGPILKSTSSSPWEGTGPNWSNT